MAVASLQNILDDARLIMSDTQVTGGEVFTNSYILGQSGGGLFGEPYRTMYGKMAGGSHRVRPTWSVVIPANTTVLIPSTAGITDFAEPEMVEERSLTTQFAVASTDTATPINVTMSAPHGYSIGSVVEGDLSGVVGTYAPWGNWFALVTGASTFSLNGSASDGVAGVGGSWYPTSSTPYTEVFPADLPGALDGQPSSTLGNYIWANGRMMFRGATGNIELRLTYWASGTAPVNPNYVIWIDNCRDFLAYGTAANCARSKGWYQMEERLRNKAYGDPSHPEELSLIDIFYMSQVMADQRGPARRQRPFRDHRYRWGSYLLG